MKTDEKLIDVLFIYMQSLNTFYCSAYSIRDHSWCLRTHRLLEKTPSTRQDK